MTRRARRMLIVLFVAAALAFAGAALLESWGELRAVLSRVEGFGWRLAPGWLAASLGLATVNLFWMGSIWVYLYRSGGGGLGYPRGVRVWLATNLGRYIPGKVWQLSGLAVHLRQTGESGALALGSALAFQVVTLLTGLAAGLGAVGARPGVLPGGSALSAALVAAALLALLHPSVVGKGMELTARLLREEIPTVDPPAGRALAAAAVGMLIAWGVYGLGLWCLLNGVTEREVAGPALLTGIFAASYVAGYLVLVAPGGLVVREGAMAGLLVALAPVGGAVAAALALLARVWVTASELAGLGLSLLVPDDADPAAVRPEPGATEGDAERREAAP